MKIFFNSRSAMRSHNSGKQYDHGLLTTKRWYRDLSDNVQKGQDKREQVLFKVNREGEIEKQIPVYYYNMKAITFA